MNEWIVSRFLFTDIQFSFFCEKFYFVFIFWTAKILVHSYENKKTKTSITLRNQNNIGNSVD